MNDRNVVSELRGDCGRHTDSELRGRCVHGDGRRGDGVDADARSGWEADFARARAGVLGVRQRGHLRTRYECDVTAQVRAAVRVADVDDGDYSFGLTGRSLLAVRQARRTVQYDNFVNS